MGGTRKNIPAKQQFTSRKVSEPPQTQEQYSDTRSPEYKSALAAKLDSHRTERYAHLTESRFEELRKLILEYSDTFVVDGAPIGVIDGYEFDIELESNVRPVRHQLPKMSQREMEKEQHHITKAEALSHLRIPTDAQKSEWSTRTHVVYKKDDEMGRWICDFRPLNAVTRKRPTPIGDVFAKTRLLAGRRWNSGLDAWSVFNQMRASERASRLLRIIASKGVRHSTLIPFRVTNGPPFF